MQSSSAINESWTLLRQSLVPGGAANLGRAAQVQRTVAELLAHGALPPHVRRLRIACLRSVTIEPLMPLLVSSMAARDFAASVELGQLGNYFAESMQPDSFLRRGDFDVCIVLVPLDLIAADIAVATSRVEDVRRSMQHYLDCLDHLAAWYSGLIVVCNFAAWQPALARRFQSRQSRSPRYAIGEANRILATQVESHNNMVISDLDYLASRAGADKFFSARDMMTVVQPFSPAGFQALGEDWAELCRMHFRGSPKCIVVDCDNTLWGGVVGEDGVQGLRLGETYPGVCFQQFQRQLKQLKELGFLLAVNSKNNEADVRAVFEQHPGMVLRWDDFAAARVNWQDKASNMSALAEELNLGVDSFLFIDDNAFEIELVRGVFPGILTLTVPAEAWKLPELLPACPALDCLGITAEDRRKAEMYAQERQRIAVQEHTASLDEYLARLGLKMTIERFDAQRHSQRAVQLLQKTNQFNLTTRRYAEKELLELARGGALIYLASLKDNFGDYGRIALAIVRLDGPQPVLDNFLMSCRAIGRKAETMFLAFVIEKLKARGLGKLQAQFIPSARNQVSAGFLLDHGFQLLEKTDNVECYERELKSPLSDVVKYFEMTYMEDDGGRSA